MMISQSAHVNIGGFVFPLGTAYGECAQDICNEVADRLETLAVTLRGEAAHPRAEITEIAQWVPFSDDEVLDQRQIAAWFQRATGKPQ